MQASDTGTVGTFGMVAARVVTLGLALVLAACGVVDRGPAEILSFTASKAVLARGQETTLVAEFTGFRATIDQGIGEVTSGVPVTVSPAAATTYMLTVTGDDGEVMATTEVAVFDAVVEVTTSAAAGPGSLASAMALANGSQLGTAISFTLPTPATIEVSQTLVSSGTTTLIGPGAGLLTLSGAGQRRIFFVRSGSLTMSGVTLTKGLGAGGAGGMGVAGGSGGGGAGMGGALFINGGAVTLRNVVLADNVARGGTGGVYVGSGLANGGGGGGFGGAGTDGSNTTSAAGGTGGPGGELGGTPGSAGGAATGDGAGGGGAGAGQTQNGGAGGFGAGGGGAGGFPQSGRGGFGGGAGGGQAPMPGTFGGTSVGGRGGGGAGLGGAIFLRAGTLVLTACTLRGNRALAGTGADGSAATAGKAKGGAIFSLVSTVAVTEVTYDGNVAADAGTTNADNANVYVTE